MKRSKYLLLSLSLLAVFIFISCDPQRDDKFQIDGTPLTPDFNWSFVEGDSNRVVITDLTAGTFQRHWDLEGGTPNSSRKLHDTILYRDAGTFTITLYTSMMDGTGSASASKTVSITKDAPAECDNDASLLTGECGLNGKCWVWSQAAGAVKVGPTYEDFSWFQSPAGGLQASQYDDAFCFTFDDLIYENRNNGQSVNPWNGYVPEDYSPGQSEFVYLQGTGTGGRDQIIIPDDQFIGVWDADNVMDVVSLTETQLVVRMRIAGQDGVPAAEGWFELTFVAQ